MWPNPQETADLVTFAGEILNGKLQFLCNVNDNNRNNERSIGCCKMNCAKNRNSHRRCSVKKNVLRNFAKFTGKHLCQSLFLNKVADLRPATLLKKRLWQRCFLVWISWNFQNTFFTEHLQTTASERST